MGCSVVLSCFSSKVLLSLAPGLWQSNLSTCSEGSCWLSGAEDWPALLVRKCISTRNPLGLHQGLIWLMQRWRSETIAVFFGENISVPAAESLPSCVTIFSFLLPQKLWVWVLCTLLLQTSSSMGLRVDVCQVRTLLPYSHAPAFPEVQHGLCEQLVVKSRSESRFYG